MTKTIARFMLTLIWRYFAERLQDATARTSGIAGEAEVATKYNIAESLKANNFDNNEINEVLKIYDNNIQLPEDIGDIEQEVVMKLTAYLFKERFGVPASKRDFNDILRENNLNPTDEEADEIYNRVVYNNPLGWKADFLNQN